MTVAAAKKRANKTKKTPVKHKAGLRKFVTKRTAAAILAVLLLGVAGTLTFLHVRAASATGTIKNANGFCLDNWRKRKVNNNPIQLHSCNGTAAQKWTISGKTIKNANGYCLDNWRNRKVNNNPIQLHSCNGTAAQKWTVSGKTIKNANGYCLDNWRNRKVNNNPIQLHSCNGTAAQKWTVPVVKPPVVTTSWPATPPAQICGNSMLAKGPASAPSGAITVAAGNNSSVNFSQSGKVYWFAPGTHTLGTGQFSQIIPGANSTYIGAPGAVLDGQNLNNYAFTGQATGVKIRYLTIKNFKAPRDEGVVNHDAAKGWTIEYATIANNKGAGLMAGTDNLYRYNCLKDNGQYAINACCGGDTDTTDIQNWTLDHNEIVGNNTDDWENQVEGCGCTGGVKFWLNKNVTVTNNWVHHNKGAGLWLDNNNRGFIIEHNYINDNDAQAIFAEAGYDFRIRYNNILRNAIVEGREFAAGNDPFPIGAIYISESGSPTGHGMRFSPAVISYNNFDNNWGGVNLWENPDRYSGSSAHTHVSGTIKIGTLYDDAACDGANDTIPAGVTDKFRCRWSTENIVVEHNEFRIKRSAIGGKCTAGAAYCGVNGIFSGYGSYPEFGAFVIPWRITFQQGNIFRNNHYYGEWKFAGWETSNRTSWTNWRAAAPSVPANKTTYTPPSTFGQDAGSTAQP